MDFIPQQEHPQSVPWFDDVTSEGGWQGHTTAKSIGTLKSEITVAIGRLGGMVIGFQPGTFMIGDRERKGFRLRYMIESAGGSSPGQIDIAALPVRNDSRRHRSYDKRQKQALKQALYMFRQALNGLWFLQQLSPGYASLMPWAIEPSSGKTITQLWSESATMRSLLPPTSDEFIDGEFEEV